MADDTRPMPQPRQFVLIVHLADFGDTGTEDHHYRTREELIDMIESMELQPGVKMPRYCLLDAEANVVCNATRDLIPPYTNSKH